MLPVTRSDYTSIVRFDAKHNEAMRNIEYERLELQRIDSSRRAYAENRLIQLKEEEGRLQREKFEWDKSVAEKNLELIQNFQRIVRESQREKLQSEEDRHYLKLRVSRDYLIKILSEDIGKFVIISSPPEILRDDLQAFKSLDAEIRTKLTRTIEKYYGGANQSVIGYRSSIFNASISEYEALVVGRDIAPFPTLFFHSHVAYQKVFIQVTLTCPLVREVEPQTQTDQPQFCTEFHGETFLLAEWNWMNLKKEFEAQGQDHETSSQSILELISTIHLIVTLYFCDLYCLNLNPSHSPKLFTFLEDPDFPDSLQVWSQPFKDSLEETQRKIEEDLDRIRALETARLRQASNESYIDPSDFLNFSVIASGIGLLFLFTMCSQQSPQVVVDNTGTQNSMEQQSNIQVVSRARIIRRASVREKSSENSRLLAEAEVGDIAIVQGTYGSWIRLKFKSGVDGWVHEQTIEFLR
jgi:hypothetical protein